MAKVLGMPTAELWLLKLSSTRGNLINSAQKAPHKRYISINGNNKTKGRFSFSKSLLWTKYNFSKNNKIVPFFDTCVVLLFFLFVIL